MKENKIENMQAETDNPNSYEMWFRCSNCGTTFSTYIRKGNLASNDKTPCPHCLVVSGTAGVGNFTPMKFNPEIDQISQRHYFK